MIFVSLAFVVWENNPAILGIRFRNARKGVPDLGKR